MKLDLCGIDEIDNFMLLGEKSDNCIEMIMKDQAYKVPNFEDYRCSYSHLFLLSAFLLLLLNTLFSL